MNLSREDVEKLYSMISKFENEKSEYEIKIKDKDKMINVLQSLCCRLEKKCDNVTKKLNLVIDKLALELQKNKRKEDNNKLNEGKSLNLKQETTTLKVEDDISPSRKILHDRSLLIKSNEAQVDETRQKNNCDFASTSGLLSSIIASQVRRVNIDLNAETDSEKSIDFIEEIPQNTLAINEKTNSPFFNNSAFSEESSENCNYQVTQ